MFTPEQTAELQAKLNIAHVKEREQGGRKLSYLEGWWAISEANRIFGFDAWNRETVVLQETSRDLCKIKGYNGKPDYDQWRVSYLARVRVTVGAIVREGTGYGSGMAKPEALGEAIESAAKEAETDAMKRALMTFGNPFGLALYDKTQANVERDTPPKQISRDDYADDERGAPVKRQVGWNEAGTARTAHSLKKEKVWDDFQAEMLECETVSMLSKFTLAWAAKIEADKWPEHWKELAREEIKKHRDVLINGAPDDDTFPGDRVSQHPIMAG